MRYTGPDDLPAWFWLLLIAVTFGAIHYVYAIAEGCKTNVGVLVQMKCVKVEEPK